MLKRPNEIGALDPDGEIHALAEEADSNVTQTLCGRYVGVGWQVTVGQVVTCRGCSDLLNATIELA